MNSRIYFMDPLRGVLMALGVLLHAGQVFNPENTWLIHSPLTTPITEVIIHFVHVFRMPAFYIVSGFFALLTLKKYGPSLFLKLRAEKILIPFVVTALLLNSFQSWLLKTQMVSASSASESGFSLTKYFIDGQWVSHLWFLGYLFAYVFVLYAGALLLGSVPGASVVRQHWEKPRSLRMRRWLKQFPIELLLLLLPGYYLALVVVGKLFPMIFAFGMGFSLYDFLFYFQFFAFGGLLFWKTSLLQSFTKLSVIKTLGLVAVWMVVRRYESSGGETINKVMEAYARLLIIWISCHAIFSLFKTIADKPSKLAGFTSSVSYTVYLFHHSLVILFGLLFIRMGLGGLLGFLLLTLVVGSLGVAVHVFVISKYNWASFLFNGVRLQKEAEAVTTPVSVTCRNV